MENNTTPNANQFGQQNIGPTGNIPYMLEPVPNSTAVLVLGILSIATCWCYGIVGIILSIIALVLSSSARRAYNASPAKFSQGSFNNLKAGRICAIIGLSLSIAWIIFLILYFLAIFTMVSPGMLDAFDSFNSFSY